MREARGCPSGSGRPPESPVWLESTGRFSQSGRTRRRWGVPEASRGSIRSPRGTPPATDVLSWRDGERTRATCEGGAAS